MGKKYLGSEIFGVRVKISFYSDPISICKTPQADPENCLASCKAEYYSCRVHAHAPRRRRDGGFLVAGRNLAGDHIGRHLGAGEGRVFSGIGIVGSRR